MMINVTPVEPQKPYLTFYMTVRMQPTYGMSYNWLSQNLTSTIHLDKTSVLLGNTRNEYIVNALIITTKHEIYKCKCKETIINMIQLKMYLKGKWKRIST